MNVKDLRLRMRVGKFQCVILFDQEDISVCRVAWGKYARRTKLQAIAIANRLCDRFNAGQEGN